jgi:hypothetical protein
VITPRRFPALSAESCVFIRVALTLALFYVFIAFVVNRFPVLAGKSIKHLAAGTLLTILSVFAGYGMFRLLRALHALLRNALPGLRGTLIRPLHIKTVEILSEERIVSLLTQTLRVIYLGANILLLYIFLPIVFSFFEFTRNWLIYFSDISCGRWRWSAVRLSVICRIFSLSW